MAIQNASDLLVYAKTTDPAPQKTRIYVKTIDPVELPDGASSGTVKLNNVTNGSGVVSDNEETTAVVNNGGSILIALTTLLGNKDYSPISNSFPSGDYTYRDFTNGANGIVPTLEIVSGTSTLNEGAIIIEIVTPGSSAIFDPVAFSTSASFSTNVDLRDITNKDSGGYSESLGGLRSFEVSTDILQSINPDVPLDGTDFFDKLKTRSLVDLSFSDRIRNIIRTNLTQSGVDGFTTQNITQVNLQASPPEIGGNTASSIESTSANQDKLQYTIGGPRLEGKKLSWSFYVRGDGSTTKATFFMFGLNEMSGSNRVNPFTTKIIGGNGSESISDYTANANHFKIEGLDTTWCRVVIEFSNAIKISSNTADVRFTLYPGLSEAQSSNKIFTSSWQIEQTNEATDYQDPTDITHWQGNALVSSLSFDSGVEDNLTCSATFTGTGNVYPNGLGPELIGDTGFDLANDGSNPASSWWYIGYDPVGASVIEDGYFKMITTGLSANTYLQKLGILTIGDYYLLTYTVATTPSGAGFIVLEDTWGTTTNIPLNTTPGTYEVYYRAGEADFTLKRGANPTTRWLSSISLKKVL